MTLIRRATPLALLLLAGCLENEENITIRADGSAAVRLNLKGDAADLEHGYPLPSGGSWRAVDDATRQWLAGVRPPKNDAGKDAKKDVRLAVEAEFKSVDDLPTSFADPTDPYATAYLQRGATLRVVRKGKSTMYVFERWFGMRRQRRWDPMRAFETQAPDEIKQKLEVLANPTEPEWRVLHELIAGGYRDMTESFVRDACLGIYLERDASLRPAALERIVQHCRGKVGEIITVARMKAIFAVLKRAKLEDRPAEPNPLQLLEEDTERALRAAFAAQLGREKLDRETHNFALAGLEWCLTASYHTDDLMDEKFRLNVRMPGVVVGGNFHRRKASDLVSWEVEGEWLRDREARLRVVSVVE